MLQSNQISVLADEISVSKKVAQIIYEQLTVKLATGEQFVLGCPGGRTPRQTYLELGKLIAQDQIDLNNLWIVMMDDYVDLVGDEYRNVPEDAHYSCRRFAQVEIFEVINRDLPSDKQIPQRQVITPDAAVPDKYEETVANLGIDLFILASGASDGHIAFNGPGTKVTDRTRIVALADTTRADNLKTFPDFADISEVPKYGVTIGPASIKEYSKQVVMILLGSAKAEAFQRITNAALYDQNWPATITVECQNALVVADKSAANS